MKIFLYLTLILVFGLNKAFAQFQTGIFSSNHAGVMGVTINPANTNYLNNGTDFQLIGYEASVMNNGFYLKPQPITQLISPEIIKSFTDKSSSNGESINQTFDRVFDLKRSLQANNYIFAGANLYGPSLLINYNRHSFGLLTSFKTSSGTINLPPELAIFVLKGSTAIELQGKSFLLNKVVSGTSVYSDIAANYSYEIADTYTAKHRLGITAHYLIGSNSMVFEDLGKSKWTVIGDSTIDMTDGNLLYNYAATKATTMSELIESRGSGFAFDIGYTYVRKKKHHRTILTVCPNIRFGGKIRDYQDYKWRVGASIMDIGYIDYNHQTVYSKYENAYGPSKNLDQAFYMGFFALDRKLFYDYSGNFGTTYTREDKYRQYTATRINVQFDYTLKQFFYIGFTGSHRLPISQSMSMRAPNIMSLSFRYEKLGYEIGVPVSLIEYQFPVMGLNFRVGPFYIGTNHLLEVIGLRNIHGADMFMGLKFNLSNFRGV